MLMSGSEPFIQSQYYPWPQSQSQSSATPKGQSDIHPSWNSISATLAPSALDMENPTSASDNALTRDGQKTDQNFPSSALDFSFESSFKGVGGLTREDSTQGFASGQLTPGDGMWDDFINEGGSWGEEAAG